MFPYIKKLPYDVVNYIMTFVDYRFWKLCGTMFPIYYDSKDKTSCPICSLKRKYFNENTRYINSGVSILHYYNGKWFTLYPYVCSEICKNISGIEIYNRYRIC